MSTAEQQNIKVFSKNLQKILRRTGYSLSVSAGQRKYGGPPPEWKGPNPGRGFEVFCGNIRRDVREEALIPLFEKCGTIWELRLLIDSITGYNRGYAFVTFTTTEAANLAVNKLDNHELTPGKKLSVNISYPNVTLFVGNIPRCRMKQSLKDQFGYLTRGLVDVLVYISQEDTQKNRGFCFLVYESHKAASFAKRRLGRKNFKVWGHDIIVDWAVPLGEFKKPVSTNSRTLYVGNLNESINKEKLSELFYAYGKFAIVKKVKTFAFVYFENEKNAIRAVKDLNGTQFEGAQVIVSIAKPYLNNEALYEIEMEFFRQSYPAVINPRHALEAAESLRTQSTTESTKTDSVANQSEIETTNVVSELPKREHSYAQNLSSLEPPRLATNTVYSFDYSSHDLTPLDYTNRSLDSTSYNLYGISPLVRLSPVVCPCTCNIVCMPSQTLSGEVQQIHQQQVFYPTLPGYLMTTQCRPCCASFTYGYVTQTMTTWSTFYPAVFYS